VFVHICMLIHTWSKRCHRQWQKYQTWDVFTKRRYYSFFGRNYGKINKQNLHPQKTRKYIAMYVDIRWSFTCRLLLIKIGKIFSFLFIIQRMDIYVYLLYRHIIIVVSVDIVYTSHRKLCKLLKLFCRLDGYWL